MGFVNQWLDFTDTTEEGNTMSVNILIISFHVLDLILAILSNRESVSTGQI